MIKIKKKLILIAGIVGFVIPWIFLIVSYLACNIAQCGDYFYATPIIFLISILTLLLGLLIGVNFSSKIKYISLLNLLVILLALSIFLIYYIQYIMQPRIEQRGEIGMVLLLILLGAIVFELIIFICGKLTRLYRVKHK